MRTLSLFLAAVATAAPVPEADAEKAAKAFVEAKKATNGELKALKDDALAAAFPDATFYTVRFRQWPVAVAPADGFQASNVLMIDGKGDASLTTGGMQLARLFQKVTAKDEKAAVAVAKALLLLEAELLQDGFYKFKLEPDFPVKQAGDKREVTGKMLVTEGGNGEITATVTFDATGAVAGTALNHTVKPGPRPRCQATQLLHPDPDVRAVCEANLLFLGRAARDYLAEQRAKASPELQAEIDRVWRRIEAGER